MQTSAEASPPRLIRRPILTQVGALMAVILVLGVSAMLGSMVIAQVNQGMASAVNQAGTLRMQSYRIGMALAAEQVPAARGDARPAGDQPAADRTARARCATPRGRPLRIGPS